jgi:hypothetical protein
MKLLAGFEMGKISLMLDLVGRSHERACHNRDVDKHQRGES